MGAPFLGLHHKSQSRKAMLLMERADNIVHNDCDHVIDITGSSDASSSNSSHDHAFNDIQQRQAEDHRPSSTSSVPVYQTSFSSSRGGSNQRNSSFGHRANGRGLNRRPFNSGLWISVELVLTMSQIVVAIVVLSLSTDEHPHTPLFLWVVGYASGCVAVLPLLYWRYRHRNHASEQGSSQSNQASAPNNLSMGPTSVSGFTEGDNRRENGGDSRAGRVTGTLSPRLKVLIEYFRRALDCFFAIWFVVGNVWIFGGHTSSSDAPNLYRLCIAFLTFSCIGYAMPFLLCAAICCCLPCIISVMGFREDPTQSRGATTESINSLPTYKFKTKKNRNGDDKENGAGVAEGGIIAAGTEKELVVSGEDAVCCICLAKYANNDELRELPCSHFFHKECVDKWLKINASCPLCKGVVGETLLQSLTDATGNLQRSTMF